MIYRNTPIFDSLQSIHMLVTMAALLLLVWLIPGIISLGQGSSHCMADCNIGQHDPLFMKYTAVNPVIVNRDCTLYCPLQVYMKTYGSGWTVFQRTQDGSVVFYLNWVDYEEEFGNLTGESWLGLSKVHHLTSNGINTLRVNLGDFENNTAFA